LVPTVIPVEYHSTLGPILRKSYTDSLFPVKQESLDPASDILI